MYRLYLLRDVQSLTAYSLQVNNLASPLLSLRLLPHMEQTAVKFSTTPRLVTVASDVHYWAVIGQELIETPTLLAKLSDETYCTPRHVFSPIF